MSLPFVEGGAITDQFHQMRCVDCPPCGLCGLDESLSTIARPAARDPGPLVTLVRKRTVAKVDSIGLVVRWLATTSPFDGRRGWTIAAERV